jgi:hypothetical protein
MSSASIQSLRPNVSREDALEAFAAAGFTSLYWRLRAGPMQRIADVFVPFWIFRTRYELGGAVQTRIFALDAVDGSLDLFEFPRVPQGDQLIRLETRNYLRPALSETQAEGLLREKVLRVIFQQGFFKVRNPKMEVVREAIELHVPYWLGFYGDQREVRCRVMDAVRRRMEGAKAAAFFEEWLAA